MSGKEHAGLVRKRKIGSMSGKTYMLDSASFSSMILGCLTIWGLVLLLVSEYNG